MTNTTMADTPQGHTTSPLGMIHKSYLDSKAYKQKEFDPEKSRELIGNFLEELSTEDNCRDMYTPTKICSCSCMNQWADMDAQEKECVVDYLLNFATLKQDEQQRFVLKWHYLTIKSVVTPK